MVLEICLKLAWERAGGHGWEGRCTGDPPLELGSRTVSGGAGRESATDLPSLPFISVTLKISKMNISTHSPLNPTKKLFLGPGPHGEEQLHLLRDCES